MDCIYGIINRMNNQILYIGSTKDLGQRKSKHKSYCKECDFKLYLVNLQRGQIKRCFKLSKAPKLNIQLNI